MNGVVRVYFHKCIFSGNFFISIPKTFQRYLDIWLSKEAITSKYS